MTAVEEKIFADDINESIAYLQGAIKEGASSEKDWYELGRVFGKLETAEMLGLLNEEEIMIHKVLKNSINQAFKRFT